MPPVHPPLALTPGEPAGIGPDLCVLAARRERPVPWVAVADPDLLSARAERLELAVTVETYDPARPAATAAGTLPVDPVPLARPAHPGKADPANAGYVLETLRRATAGCQEGRYAGLVTGPVHKGLINEAGVPFTGHTEFLAGLTGTGQVVMMLVADSLRVALATTHLPLKDVSAAITRPHLERVCRILEHDLRTRFGLTRPRILVCGLNPHAGEGGHLGHEEAEVITPVLEALRAEGLDLVGPLPADTAFVPRTLEGADAVLAMYHDQGLPVLKHRGFGRAVNVTLGLPIVRTSVDHGTAFDLAGTGRADPGSLEAALALAARMVSGEREGVRREG